MRASLFLLITLVPNATAQTNPNMACIERLEVPTYPPLAGAARISGVVIPTVLLGDGGSVASISFTADNGKPHPILVHAAEKSLRNSTFARTCAGQQVKVVFNFKLEGGPVSRGRWIPSVSFIYPNEFWIIAPTMEIQP